jgi:hypothetical protein
MSFVRFEPTTSAFYRQSRRAADEREVNCSNLDCSTFFPSVYYCQDSIRYIYSEQRIAEIIHQKFVQCANLTLCKYQ